MQKQDTLEGFQRKFDELRSMGVRYYEVVFQDLSGAIRGRLLKPETPDDVLKGFRIDAYSTGFAGVEYSDALLVPDLDTLRVYRTRLGRTGFIIGDLYVDGKPLPLYPRHALRQAESSLNIKMLVGAELEFYLTRDFQPLDEGSYMHVSPFLSNTLFLAEIMDRADESGVKIRAAHHEVGPGQYEVLPEPLSPLGIADTIVFLKKLLWEAAAERGIQATFMPKPFTGLPGNGLHLHVSLNDGGRNILVEDGELTERALNVIAGILDLSIPLAILTNPTVNSYKRLIPGYEAPVYVSWGRGNRSTMVRIPVGAKSLSGTIEYRLPDSSGNVYLKVLALVYAVTRGLEEKLEPPPECRYNAFERDGLPRVPSSLGEALETAKGAWAVDGVVKVLLDKLSEIKAAEWRAYLRQLKGGDGGEVTSWEVQNYFFM